MSITALSSVRCCREFTQHLTSTTGWCQRQRLPALQTRRKVPDQALSRCFKGQTQTERKEGRQEEHSRLDGWGQPDQET